jgi:pimeloyl-ACP methyl ester carboxylesterase
MVPGARAARPRRALAVALVAVAVLAACSSTSAGRAEPTRRSTTTTTAPPAPWRPHVLTDADWHSCDEGECATYDVPLDWARPQGSATVPLALARRRASDPARRVGSLFVNPGGPGAPGTDFVGYVAAQLPDAITDRFDIVGWDPRGTGRSAPVDCGDDLDPLFAVDTAPDDPTERAALEAAAQDFVADCVRGTGERLRFVSTASTVRDLDALRAALGEEQLDYLGFSYGTYLGAMYAARYPARVRTMVLDGAVDPARSVEDLTVEQARGFDASLDRFLAWCGRGDRCEFAHGGDPAAAYRALAARVDAEPIVDGDEVFGPTQLDLGVGALLYGGGLADRTLAAALSDLADGDPSALRIAYEQYVEREADGSYAPGWPAFIAISCADGPNLSLAAMEALQQRAAVDAPWFGAGNVGLGYPCAFWPHAPDRTGPVTFSAPRSAPIMVIGTEGDPATPVAWAAALAAELGSGRLLRVDDSTHTAALNGDPCVDRAVTRYVVHGVPPETGATCPSR